MKRLLLALALLLLTPRAAAQTVCLGSDCPPSVVGTFSTGTFSTSVTVGTATTAGNAICSFNATITGASATSNFQNCLGTFPATVSTTTRGASLSFTSDNDAQVQEGLYVNVTGVGAGSTLRAISAEITPSATNNSENSAVYGLVNIGYVNNNFTYGGNFVNNSAPTGSRFIFGARGLVSNNVNGTYGIGLFGASTSINNGGAASRNVGVLGIGDNASGTPAQGAGVIGIAQTVHTAYNGGLFWLNSATNLITNPTVPTITGTAALVADNGAVAANIFEARDNGTAMFTIADGGNVTAAGIVNVTGQLAMAVNTYFTLGGTSSANGGFRSNTLLTPDSAAYETGTNAESLHFYQAADGGFDFNNCSAGTASFVEPSLCFHSTVQDTTQFQAINVIGMAGGFIKTLTESSATDVLSIPVASGVATGGRLFYRIFASDATDQQVMEGSIQIMASNKAGTETCQLTGQAGTTDASITQLEDFSGGGLLSAGTFTYAITCLTGLTNEVRIQVNAVSSLTQTTLNFTGTYVQNGPGLPARQ